MSEEELKLILNDEISKVGKSFVRSGCNSHRYKKNKKYLHFFKHKESIEEIKKFCKNDNKEYFVCEFDIPMLILLLGRGIGYYKPKGYDLDRSEHVEYIVQVDIFKTQWLKSFVLENNNEKADVIKTTN